MIPRAITKAKLWDILSDQPLPYHLSIVSAPRHAVLANQAPLHAQAQALGAVIRAFIHATLPNFQPPA